MRHDLPFKIRLVSGTLRIVFTFLLVAFALMGCESSTLSELAEEDGVVDLSETPDEVNLVTYNNRAATILNNACVECHNSVNPTAGIQLQNFDLAREVAESGRMIIRMTSDTNPMPPSGNLADPIIEDVIQWIEDGLLEN